MSARDWKYPATGQSSCHDVSGQVIPCPGTGQDGEIRTGMPWPQLRFQGKGKIIEDRLTGLEWSRDALPAQFPLTWQESLDYVRKLNHDVWLGYTDWRLPNRRELRSLMSHDTRLPALPEGHPFTNVFSGWYWSSTTAAIAPAHAWYMHMEGARMFYGGKDQSYMLWPVRGEGNGLLARTGQVLCYGSCGDVISCTESGQDGELQKGRVWPVPRFEILDHDVLDHLTGLCWYRNADLTGRTVDWLEALSRVKALARRQPGKNWRLPNINELETLVDCSRSGAALPNAAPFENIRAGYWSSTTSMFEPDWAWALYLDKGAIGVGQKPGRHFYVWAVRTLSDHS
ncbi:MAG TPA: DUF1566 domain-containing protein [Thiolapillus brandeum]|uniref:DUF1566 domain-containing protein n=1 Tax=Thiolapillus brandeum TaxID=1076588 RepID=A0A831K2Q4_9GAMM|nr:DUF1566 domain-containing protein [Thiolapillus brandeum]